MSRGGLWDLTARRGVWDPELSASINLPHPHPLTPAQHQAEPDLSQRAVTLLKALGPFT